MSYIKDIYKSILKELNQEESSHAEFGVYQSNNFIKNTVGNTEYNSSLNLKIKENRKQSVVDVLNKLSKGHIVEENKYKMVYEIKKGKNYVICDYVVNSHVTIPQSFLKHFGRKDDTGAMVVDYIDIKTKKIKSKKVKDYGAEYAYYDRETEEFLSKNFETRIANINKEIDKFRNGKITNIKLTEKIKSDIYNFFLITLYRNPKSLKIFNEESLSSKLLGGIDHNEMLKLIRKIKYENFFKKFKINIIINKTNRDFIINDTMISRISVEKSNPIIIIPINKKECLALLEKNYSRRYYINGEFYYMNPVDENAIEDMNKQIYMFAKYYNENVIGSKDELEILLNKEDSLGLWNHLMISLKRKNSKL